MTLELSGLRYLDSSALEVLFDLRRRLDSRRQQLVIDMPFDSPARRTLELVGLVDFAPVEAQAD